MNRQAWGLAPGYHDIAGHWYDLDPDTEASLLEAMRAEGVAPPGTGADDPLLFVAPGAEARLAPGGYLLATEDGGSVRLVGDEVALPPDLPLGYHRLTDEEDGRERLVIVSPGRCHLPADLRTWGWAVQLYSARSEGSWGMGDLSDLGRLGRWSAGLGAGMLLLNPLHATLPSGPQDSPYYPSSRCFRSPLYLRVEDVPGAGAVPGIDGLAAAGRALNQDRRIDRARVWKLKAEALGLLWERFRASGGDERFDAYVAAGGAPLRLFALHCALDEHFPGVWPEWPPACRRPDSAAVARFAAVNEGRVGFHAWLQWLTDSQVRAAGREIDLVADLAVGVDPGGADAWAWQDCLALGARVGAPPDQFNAKGQDWGVPPFDPWRLRLAGYEPYVRMLRAAFGGAGGIRVDHVMGLFRLFWIPAGEPASAGGYVTYRSQEMLDLLALESVRARAWVVGEDLGTVEGHVRGELAERAVLTYRLLWFEPDRPEQFPVGAMAAVTTHDLPTVAGLWSGFDLEEQRAIDLAPNEDGQAAMRQKVKDWAGVDDDAPPPVVVEAAYKALARAPSMVLTATLEDAVGIEERPNIPGTVHERPNWSLALPVPLEGLESLPLAASVAAALRRRPDLAEAAALEAGA